MAKLFVHSIGFKKKVKSYESLTRGLTFLEN